MLRDEMKNSFREKRVKALKAIPARTVAEQVELDAYEAQIAAEFSNSISKRRDGIRSRVVLGQRPPQKLGQLGKRFSTTHNKGASPSVFEAILPDGQKVVKSTYRIHTDQAVLAIYFDSSLRKWFAHSICSRQYLPEWLINGMTSGKYRIVEVKRTRWGHP